MNIETTHINTNLLNIYIISRTYQLPVLLIIYERKIQINIPKKQWSMK